ncbi:hypothetical protein QMK33_06710 [Hymenobacter sp. H14-R3]|uniref:hypothetical protein n=1 Tax=Hymenobacter sp. H14-R3 TaxID=3046308 RepID=UPI0024BAC0C6|nr:hypothetical protein [Hymenobacter sp. H14-R3]MDJ0364838.1 hypothetical protein [Hymenobacter sp. H14-R3]
MTNPSLETFKAFLQDEAIQQKYDLSEAIVAEAGLFGKPTDKMIVVLIREMVNKYFESKSPNITAKHLSVVLSNRL